VSAAIDWERWLHPRLRSGRAYLGLPVAVVGASGFIGAACAEALGFLGAALTIVSRSPLSTDLPRGIRHVCGNVADPEVARAAASGQAVVFDFIGTVAAVESNRDPERSLREDCAPHLSLFLRCAEASPAPLVMFPSSRLVYGRPDCIPVAEDHPLRPSSIYGVHKITLEHYLRVLGATRGLPSVVLRVANPYGPYQKQSTRGHGILNQFVRQVLSGNSIGVYGDGAQLRDYVFIPDLISMMLLAAIEPRCRGETFNVGGKRPVTLGDAAETIVRLAGRGTVRRLPWPEDALQVETGDYASDMRKLEAALGDLDLTSFEDGVRETIAFYCDQRGTDAPAETRRAAAPGA
jgi:UDP-glucose 4-epimerase